MSARAVLKGLEVVEIPMSYAERVGESKLRISSDGWRFLRALIDGVLLFRPERLFLFLAVATLACTALLTATPIEFYLRNGMIEEWMIYRFVVAFLLGSAGVLALSEATVANRMSELVLDRGRPPWWMSFLTRSFRGVPRTILVFILGGASLALVWPGLVEYVSTGQVTLHWSRVFVAAFALLIAFQSILTGMLLRIMTLWLEFALSRGSGSSR